MEIPEIFTRNFPIQKQYKAINFFRGRTARSHQEPGNFWVPEPSEKYPAQKDHGLATAELVLSEGLQLLGQLSTFFKP